MKKYVPSGYQILSIDCSRVDNDGNLLEETEDEKVLYELFRNNRISSKPILLNAYVPSGFSITGFAIYNIGTLSILDLVMEDGSINGYTQVRLTYNNNKINVRIEEQ